MSLNGLVMTAQSAETNTFPTHHVTRAHRLPWLRGQLLTSQAEGPEGRSGLDASHPSPRPRVWLLRRTLTLSRARARAQLAPQSEPRRGGARPLERPVPGARPLLSLRDGSAVSPAMAGTP